MNGEDHEYSILLCIDIDQKCLLFRFWGKSDQNYSKMVYLSDLYVMVYLFVWSICLMVYGLYDILFVRLAIFLCEC